MLEKRRVDKLVGIGPDIAQQQHLFRQMECHFFDTTNDFMQNDEFDNLQHEVILIKGARSFNFDRLTEMLVEKARKIFLGTEQAPE